MADRPSAHVSNAPLYTAGGSGTGGELNVTSNPDGESWEFKLSRSEPATAKQFALSGRCQSPFDKF